MISSVLFQPSNQSDERTTMPKMRAKVQLAKIEQHPSCEILQFNAVAASKYPDDGSDEDNTFAKFSPSATFSITVANPALIGSFKVGEKYYVDFSPAD
ncbi:hypothetical protein [Herbaspirillum sp. UBA812]|uniref:hypothetical protein n=2 Tax=unclassified Herbaspirillum TaxID=2624150 RepID=UPI00257E8B46|nr:hypothetical protein [Herbaspirillum sp. UBA812]